MSLLSKLKFSRRIWSIEKKIGQKIFLLSQRLRNCKFRRDFNLIFLTAILHRGLVLGVHTVSFQIFCSFWFFRQIIAGLNYIFTCNFFFMKLQHSGLNFLIWDFFFNLENGHDISLWFQNQFSFSSWANPGRMSMDSDSLAKLLNLFLIHFHALWRQHFKS